MKKLLFIAMFSIGFFTMSNAQFLTYTLTNSGLATWDFAMANAGAPGATYELGIAPAQVRSGLVSSFAFPLEWKAQNSNNCGTYQLVPGPTPGVFVPIACAVPTGIKYKVDVVIPFVLWHLELKFG